MQFCRFQSIPGPAMIVFGLIYISPNGSFLVQEHFRVIANVIWTYIYKSKCGIHDSGEFLVRPGLHLDLYI